MIFALASQFLPNVYLLEAFVQVAKLLVDSGWDLGLRTNYGLTPLHAAAWWGHTDMITFLAARGAELDCQVETHGETPLHYAAAECRAGAVRLLLSLGADRELARSTGHTPAEDAGSADTRAVFSAVSAGGGDQLLARAAAAEDWTTAATLLVRMGGEQQREILDTIDDEKKKDIFYRFYPTGLAEAVRDMIERGVDPNQIRPADLLPGARVYYKGGPEHRAHAYQYAKTSHEGMDPETIIYPTGAQDILSVVQYAKDKGVGIAVRTGGHQYSGEW